MLISLSKFDSLMIRSRSRGYGNDKHVASLINVAPSTISHWRMRMHRRQPLREKQLHLLLAAFEQIFKRPVSPNELIEDAKVSARSRARKKPSRRRKADARRK